MKLYVTGDFECPECGVVGVERPDGDWLDAPVCDYCETEMDLIEYTDSIQVKIADPKKEAKIKRRLSLLDELLDYAMRTDCKFFACKGPEAPIRFYYTCSRCRCINRALRLGLVKKVKESYVRENPSSFISEGYLEQFSAVDGELVR